MSKERPSFAETLAATPSQTDTEIAATQPESGQETATATAATATDSQEVTGVSLTTYLLLKNQGVKLDRTARVIIKG